MSDDSGDLSDFVDPSPSGSKGRLRSDQQKKKRRIVMRIEFDDSDEETTSSSSDSCNDDDEQPSLSGTHKQHGRTAKQQSSSNCAATANSDDDSDQFRKNATKRLQSRRSNVLALDDGSSMDGSSSGSEIIPQATKQRGKVLKKVIISEDEREAAVAQSPLQEKQSETKPDDGFSSDSSSNELLEKCPICLLTFRKQEIGSPATCAHVFCANCIEAWSRNVQTCPIDRNEFDKIVVRESFENRNIVREIIVNKGKINKELELDADTVMVSDEEEDVTNCQICNSPEREDVMLLCDSCNEGYHIDCLTPALEAIPEGSWYCGNCFDSNEDDEDDAVEEDLNMLYEDIRDMGIPQSRLRVTEVHQPRILRTRQNERIRAAVLRRTRASIARAEATTTTMTTTTTATRLGRQGAAQPATSRTITTTTSTTRRNVKKRKRRTKRRRARQRTYVVEYDLNNFDEKFAIKTTKKVIRRRRRKRTAAKKSARRSAASTNNSGGRRTTAKQRLAEQMGVKQDRIYINPSHATGAPTLSLFGNANDLEYFSDSDTGGGFENEIHIETGHGTALQTSVRISNFGTQRSRKSLLLGRLQRNQIGSVPAADTMPRTEAPIDILSNIMDMQDRWHTASRNLEAVRINADGTLQLPPSRDNANNAGIPSSTQNPSAQNIIANEVTQAPMYPQGSGSNQNFNNSGGGRYSNNNFNNQGRGGGGSGSGGSNQYRHSTGGMNSSGGGGSNLNSNFNLVGRGNFSFSTPDYNSNQNQGSNFMAFNNRDRDNRENRDDDRFNPRNRQQQNNSNNNQRISFPFNNMPQNQQQQQQPPQHQQQPMHMDNQLFGGLPPPVQQLPPPMQQIPPPPVQQCLPPPMQSEHQLFGGLPPPMGPQMPPQNDQQLFGGLPPPMIQQHQIPPPQNEHQLFSSLPPPPTFEPQLPPAVQQHLLQPPGLLNMNIPPPINIVPVLRSAVPPPPAPPAALANWNSTLFSYAQDDDDDDSNCPNFSVYSAESQEVAKATVAKSSTNDGEVPKEDDENEDLVQLDDDDDIPMPPENNTTANSDLYEPENPTEEIDTENESEDETENKKEVEKEQNDISKQSDSQESQKIDKDIVEKQPIIAENANENHDEYDPEQETDTVVSIHGNDIDEQQEEETEKEQVEEEEEEEEDEDEVEGEDEVEEDIEEGIGETALEKLKENDDQTAKTDDEAKEKSITNETAVDAECNDTIDKPTDCEARSPSPELSSLGGNKLQDADVTVSNRKGVLELYDDSDWDELDIDRPRSTERMDDFITKQIEDENEKDKEKVKEKQDKANESKDDKEEEEDRSYTPCLDEKNDPEDVPGSPATGEAIVGGTPDLTPASLPKNAENGDKDDSEEEEGIIHDNAEVVAGVETELISEDDENVAANNTSTSRRRKEKRSRRKNERSETFKKVSNKRKERNYRTEKAEKRRERMRGGSLPTSRSISRSRSGSNSRSRSRSPSRLRSRSRSNSRQKSPHGHRRNRKRRASRSPLLRSSRSRSNDKENFIHFQNYNNQGFYGRFNRGGFNNRFQNNRFNQRFQQRPRRRELPRYDVRNIVGHARNFNPKDRYGRDTSRPPRRSFSRSLSPVRRRRSFSAGSRSRSYSVSPKRKRRNSFSISPSSREFNRRSPRRASFSPPLRAHQRNRRSPISAMFRRKSQSPQRGRLSSPPRHIRPSRSVSPLPRPGGRKVTRHMQIGSPKPIRRTSRSMSGSPRYTPRLSRSRSRSPRSMSPHKRQKNKKKKPKERKKKKTKKRIVASKSPVPVRRISRQRDPYEHDMLPAAAAPKRKRHHSPQQVLNNVASPANEEPTWSPSPSPPPIREYDNNVSWTPPLVSHHDVGSAFPDMFEIEQRRVSKPNSGKKEKRKRDKKKKKTVKRRDATTGRKEKRRATRRTETPEPAPSKEVFASGNNILVSVSFNKEAAAAAASQPPQQQTTVVTLPATREDVISSIQRGSTDRQVTTIGPKKKRTHKRKKLDTKPVAIIDLERSPFQVHQEPADIIVLTDSDAANEDDLNEHEHHRGDRHLSESGADEMEQHHHRPQRGSSSGGGGGRAGSQHDQTPPMLSTIMEESYEVQQTGPKTPPEPPVIKFTLLNKQQTKVRNPLHEEVNGLNDDDMLDMEEEQMEQQQHRQDLEGMQSNQKIGPNTPPESGPCSPDVYDPFDPTKSPSLSPRSPTPPPLLLDKSQNSIGDDSGPEIVDKHNSDEPNRQGERIAQQQISSIGGTSQNNAATLNPVELVMALMSSKQQASNNQDKINKSLESQYSSVTSSHMISNSSASHDDSHGGSGMQEKPDDANSGGGGAGITVLSNVLITASKSQHIPTISSPTPPMPTKSSQNLITKLPLPKVVTGSVGSGSGIGLPSNLRNGGGGGVADDLFNDIESPYSPGSADYEDLFEPPPDNAYNAKRRSKRGKEKFDNLFGSSSPVGYLRLPSYAPSSKKFKSSHFGFGSRKLKVAKVGKSGDEQIKVYDDVPNSAVELQVKDKFLRKLNRQERVVEEVKLVLKPRFNRKQITKEDYKEIMRRAVPKICHSRSGEINPSKIKNLIEAYVKKFRAKHKKLNIINTGQVSSAVKCAAYLKKL